MKEKEFELIPIYDQESGVYIVNNFDECKAIVQKFIDECYLDVLITCESDWKSVKATRTDIRKKKETVATARKKIKEMLLGTFENQLKEIETMLGNADATLKEKVNAWEKDNKNKAEKPSLITLTIKGYDVKLIEKVRDFALKQDLQAEISKWS